MYKKTKLPVLFFGKAIILLSANQSFADASLTITPAQPVLQTVTIGSYLNSEGGTVPLAYYDGGIEWKLSASLPLPSDVLQLSGKQYTFLNGVACYKMGRSCTAIGAYITNAEGPDAPGYAPLSYFSTDSGAHWKLSATLPLPKDVSMPADSIRTALFGVACTGSGQSHCSTVGYYSNNTGATVPLSYTSSNGGKKWELSETLPLPTDVILPANKQNNILYGISCDPNGELCTAIGSYTNNNKSTVPLSYTSTNRGRSWTLNQTPFPLPADVPNTNQLSELRAISCNNMGFCTAVGYYYNNRTGVSPLSYVSSDSGATWQLSLPLPLPPDVISQVYRQKTYLNSVFCSQTDSSCSAVGYYTNKNGVVAPLSYTSVDGGYSWTVSSSPLPLPSDAATGILSNSGLFSIVCDASKNLCNSVGYYKKSGTIGIVPLSYTSTDGGITWEVTPNNLQLPADATSVNQLSRLNGVN